MKKNKILRILLIALAIFLVLIQFFPIDKTNPPIDNTQDFIQNIKPPMEVAKLIKVACYDCHANTTLYPWYTNIQPVAWWVQGHIEHGRENLNFSTWTQYDAKKKAHKLEECVEVLEGKEMPMLSYMIAHQKAWINEEQRKLLVDWFKEIQ